MKRVLIQATAVNQTPIDWENNTDNLISEIQKAEKNGVDFLCFPELCVTGYGCEDWFLSREVADNATKSLYEIAHNVCNTVVMVGLPVWYEGNCYNCVAILYKYKIVGIVAKKNLANDGIHYESRWFKEWEEGRNIEINFENYPYGVPFGDLVFEVAGVRFGFEICEDAWVANRPGINLSKSNVDIIFNPSASHFSFGKSVVRKRFIMEGSRAFNCVYVYANLLGNESGRVIYDGDVYIAANNEISCGERFSFQTSSSVSKVVDIDIVKNSRAKLYSHKNDVSQVTKIIHLGYKNFDNKKNFISDSNIVEEYNKFQEFEKALTLGLFDYARKSNAKGYVVSLSGGVDSSVCAVLVFLAFRKAKKVLGKDKAREIFGSDMIYDHLTCVYQGTRNSGDVTLNAAKDIVRQIGCHFESIDIDDIVEKYKSSFSKSFGWELDWKSDDVALQNIQARPRAPGVWLIANKESKLLISTSNRSESAVGYATMDGDTCGGLAPIAGIDKNFLRQWIAYMNEREIFDFSSVLMQEPTAELRPKSGSKAQTDEDDLMPYEILDCIERFFVRDKMGINDSFDNLVLNFNGYDKKVLFGYFKKFITLWSRNQWKRERYAPSFHLDDHNLDPKTGCRFPILSSSFKKELKELEVRIRKQIN